jgi:hypothetical protein
MRPTPAETITQIRRLLKDVIEPDLQSDYARSRLREIRAVLAQTDWDDAAAGLAATNTELAELVIECADWAEADPAREPVAAHYRHSIEEIRARPPAVTEPFEVHNRLNGAYGALLAGLADQVTRWHRQHPEDASARQLQRRLLEHFARDGHRAAR